jgi:hypothetical protein
VAEVVCQECGEPVSARDTRPAVVPGHPGSVTAAYPAAAGSAPAPGSRLTAPR